MKFLIFFTILLTYFGHVTVEANEETNDEGETPRLITEKDIKIYWVKNFPRPRKLASDYHQKTEQFELFVANVRSGIFDHKARVAALEWNIKEYQRVRDFEMADQVREDLKLELHREEERQRTEAVKSLSRSLRNIESTLGRIKFRMN